MRYGVGSSILPDLNSVDDADTIESSRVSGRCAMRALARQRGIAALCSFFQVVVKRRKLSSLVRVLSIIQRPCRAARQSLARRERNILQAPVEFEVISLAPHKALPLLVREIGHCRACRRDAASASSNKRSSRGPSGGLVSVVMVVLQFKVERIVAQDYNVTNCSGFTSRIFTLP